MPASFPKKTYQKKKHQKSRSCCFIFDTASKMKINRTACHTVPCLLFTSFVLEGDDFGYLVFSMVLGWESQRKKTQVHQPGSYNRNPPMPIWIHTTPCQYVRSTPHPLTVTTRIITFLVGNPYKPSFATGILGGG